MEVPCAPVPHHPVPARAARVALPASSAVGAGRREPRREGAPRPGLRASASSPTRTALLNFQLYATIRYLNQTAIDDTYTDSFGTTQHVDPRQDMQLNKMMFYFFGWFLDPALPLPGYVWTSNSSQGQTPQVVVAGNLQ